jgi:HptB-dependent secretion and biofilm anti anti-sigma factor
MESNEDNDKKLTISDAEYKFDIHNEIRRAFELISQNNTQEVLINFEQVEEIDSRAIGMLLQIKDRCQPNKINAKIIGCNDDVKCTLKAFHLEECFEII